MIVQCLAKVRGQKVDCIFTGKFWFLEFLNSITTGTSGATGQFWTHLRYEVSSDVQISQPVRPVYRGEATRNESNAGKKLGPSHEEVVVVHFLSFFTGEKVERL